MQRMSLGLDLFELAFKETALLGTVLLVAVVDTYIALPSLRMGLELYSVGGSIGAVEGSVNMVGQGLVVVAPLVLVVLNSFLDTSWFEKMDFRCVAARWQGQDFLILIRSHILILPESLFRLGLYGYDLHIDL